MDASREPADLIPFSLRDLPEPGDIRNQPVMMTCEHHGRWKRQETMDGPVISPDCPQCIQDRRMASDFGRAAIPPRYQPRSLETYQVEGPGQKQALEVCQTYAGNIKRTLAEGQNLLLIGSEGTGKTHLACGVARRFLESGHTALYVRTAELISMVRETWRPDSKKTERRVIRELTEPDLLIIDEVGVQGKTENEQQILFNVINGRNEQMRPVILISNLDAEDIKKVLGARSYDRIRECCRVVQFNWQSWRGKA